MNKSIIAASIAASLGIGGILGGASTPAKAAEITLSQSNIESQIMASNLKINNLQEELKNAKQEFAKLTTIINETEKKKSETNQEIVNAKRNIENLKKKINEVTELMESRNSLLKSRARSFQESGTVVRYLDVLLGSKSFKDFVDRADAVATLIDADRNILKEQQSDTDLLKESQALLQSELTSLEEININFKKTEDDLKSKKQEQSKLIQALKEKEQLIQAELVDSQVNQANNQNTKHTKTSASNVVEVAKSSGNSLFVWPTNGGYISSYQGNRWGSFHKGIDIARPSDYTIVAAISGTVTFVGNDSSRGNNLKIQSVDGYETIYSHFASISVKAGQSVSQGSMLGIMGSTGFSTGIHLDFEVYQNKKLLNPLDVLPNR